MPLQYVGLDINTCIRSLENSIIQTLWDYKILAFSLPYNTGVWTYKGKVAFIGIGVKKRVIYHGICINLYNSLMDYQGILSCGLTENITNVCKLNPQIKPKHLLEHTFEKIIHHWRHSLEDKTNLITFRNHLFAIQKQIHFPYLSLRLGIMYFNASLFWKAHEAWEVFWADITTNIEYKNFLQGLILFTSAFYKWYTQKNVAGSLSLLRKSRKKLYKNRYVATYLFSDQDHPEIIRYIDANIRMLEKQQAVIKYPHTILTSYHLYLKQDIINSAKEQTYKK